MDILAQARLLISEILILIDQGESISIEEFEKIMDNKEIIEFIGKKYRFKNINSIPENQNLIKEQLQDIYVSRNEADNIGITDNGLVYLLDCILSIVFREAYDYKRNYEDLIEDIN